ncbi:GlyGly-CTERM sorting domain-containing protein [Marinobacter sp.]|uniref:GlyGly-CTERM sorting domain-containing protein n=1 Tax=Marinobacter sp. TaxID=50741 RepID=UPI003561B335
MKQKIIFPAMIMAGLLPSISQAQAIEPSGTPHLTGQYTGHHRLTMNTIDPAAMAALTLPTTELDGVEYIVLGQSIGTPLWHWDFDAGTVTWGGDTLFAMKMVTTTYQPYNQSAIPEKTDDQVLNIENLEEITVPVTDNGDGTYTVDYAQKIHLPMAGFPIGATSTTFRIEKRDDGTLSIKTIDNETDGNGEDGVPGTRIAGVFPYVVQPQFDAEVMYPEPGTDSNGDGITDLQASLLGLSADLLDSDGDNISDADELGWLVRPMDTDADGVPDITEKGAAGSDNSILSRLSITDQSTLTFTSTDSLAFQATAFAEYQHELSAGQTLEGELLPETDPEGNAMTFFQLAFTTDAMAIMNKGLETLSYDLWFEGGRPTELHLWEKTITMNFDMETGSTSETVSYTPLALNPDNSSPNKVTVELSHTMASSTRKQLILGMTLPEPTNDGNGNDGETDDTTEPGDSSDGGSGESSGGSTGWLGLAALIALIGRTRKTRRMSKGTQM